jgi:hypothetical protein
MARPIVYTGSIVRTHLCEKLAGRRARTALAAFTLSGQPPSPFPLLSPLCRYA